ncbi:ribosomal RNA small subunit methyltransferase A [candidate division KSB1 bacterium]|nr:ribosomal RNA small subunit methyltransferase A [candidate division KSB1 bacterium]
MIIKAKQSLGQNFLVDRNTAVRIVDSYDLSTADVVIEIGPGYGVLTNYIAAQVKTLYAVEIDRRFYELLNEKFKNRRNVVLCHEDILKFDLDKLAESSLRIVGNIPYHITSQIFFHMLEYRHRITDIILLMQREVADRILAPPHTKTYGIFSVISQAYAEVENLMRVPRTVFSPRPKVESAVVRWRFVEERASAIKNHVFFRKLVRTAFQQRRKMLRNSLQPWIDHTHQYATRRPESITVPEWIELSNELI